MIKHRVWPKTVGIGPNYFAQLREAGRWMEDTHKKLIEAGFEWDGMDGYTAPAVMPSEQLKEFMK